MTMESAGEHAQPSTAERLDRQPTTSVVGMLSFWAYVGFIAAYLGVLSAAMFIFQFGLRELPCPLCITQRMAMMLASLGPIYIVVQTLRGKGSRSVLVRGTGMAILGAVLGMAMSARQILLHIAPGDPGFGEPLMGMHLYTWALISFVVVLIFCAVMLLVSPTAVPAAPRSSIGCTVAWVVVWLFLATIAINAVVVFAEAGWHLFLPDNPTSYRLFG